MRTSSLTEASGSGGLPGTPLPPFIMTMGMPLPLPLLLLDWWCGWPCHTHTCTETTRTGWTG